MAVTSLTQPYVGGGLATAFLPPVGERTPLAVVIGALGIAGSAVLVLLWHVVGGVVSLLTLAAAAAGAATFARRKIGGFTGDVLGAAGVVSETAALVVAAAKW
jgi:adenosylcobinamide-GDP ribazoletransferase